MPSPIGHVLAGLTIALSANQRRVWNRAWAKVAVVCAVLAAAPDLDLLFPRGHRTMTHSFFAVGLVFVIALAVTARAGRPHWRVTVACTLAYATHLLTDYFGADYGTPSGLQLFWPWNAAYFRSEWSIFRTTERHDPLSSFAIKVNAAALAQEILVVGPILLLAWWRRRRLGATQRR